MKPRKAPGREFEEAVHRHCKDRNPDAEVILNHKVLDAHIRRRRQADVWMKKLQDGQPHQTLVSCKDHRRKLGVKEVELLSAEIGSYGADKGALYASNGFCQTALDKANAYGIDCCRLIKDQAPGNPSEVFIDAYAAYPSFVLRSFTGVSDPPRDLLWRELLPQSQMHRDHRFIFRTLIPQLCMELVLQAADRSVARSDPNGTPDLLMRCAVPAKAGCPPFTLELLLVWHWHHLKLSGHRLNGAMTDTAGTFDGKVSLSAIPMLSGPDMVMWEPCERPDLPPSLSAVFSMLAGFTPDTAACVLSNLPVFGGLATFPPPPPEVVRALLLQRLQQGAGAPGFQLHVDVGRAAKGRA